MSITQMVFAPCLVGFCTYKEFFSLNFFFFEKAKTKADTAFIVDIQCKCTEQSINHVVYRNMYRKGMGITP